MINKDNTAPDSQKVEFRHATPILRVADFDISVAYYVNVLGFSLDWSDGQFGCVRRGDVSL